MKRRALLASLAAASLLATSPFTARAQPAQRVYRVGLVVTTASIADLKVRQPSTLRIIEDGLRELGWIDGKNLQLMWRSAEGRYERIPGLIDELLRIPVDVLVVFSSVPAAIAAEKTRRVPIVVQTTGLLDQGLVSSLGRPGRNITGISMEGTGLFGKVMQLLKSAAPALTRVAFLHRKLSEEGLSTEMQQAANELGIGLIDAAYLREDDIERAILDAVHRGANGLVVATGPATNGPHVQAKLHALTARHRLPAIHGFLSAVESGGLMAYSVDFSALTRRIPYFIDKILRGMKPADLPIEQPGNYQLYLNLKTARQLGLAIPQALVTQADRVFQ